LEKPKLAFVYDPRVLRVQLKAWKIRVGVTVADRYSMTALCRHAGAVNVSSLTLTHAGSSCYMLCLMWPVNIGAGSEVNSKHLCGLDVDGYTW